MTTFVIVGLCVTSGAIGFAAAAWWCLAIIRGLQADLRRLMPQPPGGRVIARSPRPPPPHVHLVPVPPPLYDWQRRR